MEKLDYAPPEKTTDATQRSIVALGSAMSAWAAVFAAFLIGPVWLVLVFPLLSILAVGFGILGRKTAVPGPSANRGRATAALWLGGVQLVLFALALLIMPSMTRSYDHPPRLTCASNLRQIGQGLALYSHEHGGRFPASLDDLLLHEDLTAEVFVCPSTADQRATGPTTQAVVSNFRSNPQHCSYVYVGGGLTYTTATPTHVLAYERATNHNGNGMNVLYGDGTVNWLDAKEATYVLSELNAGHNPPRPSSAGQ